MVSVFFSMALTSVYIDGFNLYYRALKNTPYKWLDLAKLCNALLPTHTVNQIRYFTASVEGNVNNTGSRNRQRTYIRALETIPSFSVHYGMFRTHRKRALPTTPLPGITGTIEVWNTEEKGTDVNLSSFLLLDGFKGLYEQALVISNDSDFALAIRMVREELGLPVGVVNPNTNPKAATPRVLSDAAPFTRRLRSTTLSNCQFPDKLMDKAGRIEKPLTW